MKILHIVPTYLPAYRYGGPILSVHTLNKWLVRAGAFVSVFTTDADGRANLDVPLGLPTDVNGVSVTYFPRSFPRGWFYSRELARALKVHMSEFDIVHITSVFLAASTLGASSAEKFKKPFLISPRGSLMREPLSMKSALKKSVYLSLVERGNLESASAIHFTSTIEREQYKSAGLPLRESVVMPNAFDSEGYPHADKGAFRLRWGIAPERRIILSMGRIGWKKGFDTLIPAFAKVLKADPRALLVVSGSSEGNYQETVERLVRKEGIVRDVVFTGPFDEIDAAALTDASLFVLPSYSENFGMAVLQAMYAGLPVVVTPEVALSEDIASRKAGLVVKKNEEEIAKAILMLIREPLTSDEMGKKGRELVMENYAAPKVADAFLGAYARIIERFNHA